MMKKPLLLFALGLITLGAMAQPDAKPLGGSGPMISVDKESHDYGTVKAGADGTCTFVVTNTGDAPLILTQCAASCGCTVPQCDQAPIKPGASTTITVKYDTQRVGPINKSVTIHSNATNTPSKVVTIKGTVEAAAGGSKSGTTSLLRETSPMAPTEKR
jgi:hypothetical protein